MFGLNWTRPSPRAMIVKNNLVKSFWNAATTVALPELGKETSLLLFDTSFPPYLGDLGWAHHPYPSFLNLQEKSHPIFQIWMSFSCVTLWYFLDPDTQAPIPQGSISTFQLSRLTSWVEMGRTLRFHWKTKKTWIFSAGQGSSRRLSTLTFTSLQLTFKWNMNTNVDRFQLRSAFNNCLFFGG